jgi:hypothetical protein
LEGLRGKNVSKNSWGSETISSDIGRKRGGSDSTATNLMENINLSTA